MSIIFLQLDAAKKNYLKALFQLLLGFGVKYGRKGLDTDYRLSYKSYKYSVKLFSGTACVLLSQQQWTKLVL